VEKLFTGWGFGVSEFCFFFLGFCFLPSVAPEGKYYVWSAEGLPSTFGAGSLQAGGRVLAGLWADCSILRRL
jgi:hypothetical protein